MDYVPNAEECTRNAQHEIHQKIQRMEKQQRRLRERIFKVEDEIVEKRDELISGLQRRMKQRTEIQRCSQPGGRSCRPDGVDK